MAESRVADTKGVLGLPWILLEKDTLMRIRRDCGAFYRKKRPVSEFVWCILEIPQSKDA